MRIKLLCICFLLSHIAIAQNKNGDINNGGFENWEIKEFAENPLIWQSANREMAVAAATKISSSISGSHAVRIETLLEGDDTIFGYVIHGSPDDEHPEYIAYHDDADSIVGWYRYDLEQSDSGLMVIGLKTGTNIETATWIKFGGKQATWKRFAYKLNPHLGTPDSIYVGFASSNAMDKDYIKIGSWVELDDVHFVDNQGARSDTIPNGDFEHWEKINAENPVDWWAFNNKTAWLGIVSAKKDNVSKEGKYALKLETIRFYPSFLKKKMGNDDDDLIPGLVSNGEYTANDNDSIPFKGVPYTSRPKKLTGYYKSYPAEKDTGFMAIVFYKNGTIIDYKTLSFTDTVDAFTFFEMDLSLDEKPDTMLMVLYAGEKEYSKLIVDDLSLSNFILEAPVVEQNTSVVVYPNPSKNGIVNILMEGKVNTPVNLEVFDLGGKKIMNIDGLDFYESGDRQIVSTLKMEEGIYFFQFYFNERKFVQKVIIR